MCCLLRGHALLLRGHASLLRDHALVIAWARIIIARARINHFNLYNSWPFLASMGHRKYQCLFGHKSICLKDTLYM